VTDAMTMAMQITACNFVMAEELLRFFKFYPRVDLVRQSIKYHALEQYVPQIGHLVGNSFNDFPIER
jgi:hypothetical protein